MSGDKSRRAVIFDLDGTLVDSAPDIHHALNAALARFGAPPLDLETVKGLVGGGARRLVERALAATGPASGNVDTVLRAFLDAYAAEPAARTQVYPGACETLAALTEGGVALGIATNKPQALTDAVLEALGLRPLFGSVIGSRDGLALKPAPDILRLALAELGVSPERAVMVGDSAADVGAAQAAGVPVHLLAHGYNHGALTTLAADAIHPDFASLRPVLIRVLSV